MEKIVGFDMFLTESETFGKIQFWSHKTHGAPTDILSGMIDDDTMITYGVYIKDENGVDKGSEFMEYYHGEDYVPGSDKRSSMKVYRTYEGEKIPNEYLSKWEELKALYNEKYKK